MASFQQLTPQEVKARLDAGDTIVLLDVRERQEFEFNHLEGAVFRPLSQIHTWVKELDKTKEYVVYCHHGMRSQQACMFMYHNGFQKLNNLYGGIDLWSHDVDPTVPVY
ncbi:MAG: sulfurtransferase [Acidobacteria bacterium]|nr:sulfurtransferase [Acidobacteriota bacterium]